MDIFKQNRYLILVIILLVILNLGTLITIWLGRPHQHPFQNDNQGSEKENMHIQQLLKDELGFNKEQAKQFLDLQRELHNQTTPINDEIKRLKKQMFDKVLENNISPTLSDSLLKLTMEKQAQIEQLTFRHLLELKKMCNPEQQKKLQLLMHVMHGPSEEGNNDGHPPPPGGINDRQPPPPGDEMPPHPNN